MASGASASCFIYIYIVSLGIIHVVLYWCDGSDLKQMGQITPSFDGSEPEKVWFCSLGGPFFLEQKGDTLAEKCREIEKIESTSPTVGGRNHR